MLIIIDTNTGIIKINKEKENDIATIQQNQTPIQYKDIDIKRKYYKKGEAWYKRIFKKIKIKTALNFSEFDKVVRQEPLLDFH